MYQIDYHKQATRVQKSINLYIGVIILFPSFFGYMSIGIAQILFNCMCILCGILILSINKKYGYPVTINKIPIILLCQLICYSITILIGFVDSFSQITPKDATDLVRPILYLLYFSIPVLLGYNSTRCIRIIAVCVTIGVLLDLVKFMPSFYPIMKLYTHLNPDGLNYARFNGTFTYCYSFGYVVLLLLAYSLNANYRFRKISIILLLLIIILTGSRSILLAALFLITFQVAFYTGGIISKFKIIGITAACAILLYLILASLDIPMVNDIFEIVERGFNAASGEGYDASFGTRNDQMERALNNLSKSPFWGVGPQKETELPIEILAGYYMSSWGLMGSMCYLSLWLIFLYYAYKCSSLNGNIGAFSKANFLWILMVPFAGMSSPVTEGVRTAPLYFIIQGVQAVIFCQYVKIGRA